jgi:polyphosphate kinase
VVRKEEDELRTYFHLGTGNYNSITARVYTDFSYFSSNPNMSEELIELFNYLTGRSLKQDYRSLLIAPFNMADQFKKLIQKEIGYAKKGLPALIIAKMNAFHENTLAETLYQASEAGVDVKLLVRGFCTLAAGVKGVSERIQVLSTIGRFLEHHRIYYFRQGATDPLDGLFFLGSADWMYRNLYNRVEVIAPILEPELKAQLWETLNAYINDQAQTWELLPDGKYRLRKRKKQGVQEKLTEIYSAQIETESSRSSHTSAIPPQQKN